MSAGSFIARFASAEPASSAVIRGDERGEQTPVRIIVFNDHPVFKSALSWKITEDTGIEFVADAVSLSETLHMATGVMHSDVSEHSPERPTHAVIADLRIGDGNSEGIESVRTLASRLDEIPVVVYSDFFSRSYATRMAEAGAAALVQKSASVKDLVAAIHAAARGSDSPKANGVAGSAA